MSKLSIQKLLIHNRVRIISSVFFTFTLAAGYPLFVWFKTQLNVELLVSIFLLPIISWIGNIWLKVNSLENQLNEADAIIDSQQKEMLALGVKVDYLVSFKEFNKRLSKIEKEHFCRDIGGQGNKV